MRRYGFTVGGCVSLWRRAMNFLVLRILYSVSVNPLKPPEARCSQHPIWLHTTMVPTMIIRVWTSETVKWAATIKCFPYESFLIKVAMVIVSLDNNKPLRQWIKIFLTKFYDLKFPKIRIIEKEKWKSCYLTFTHKHTET